MLKQRHSYHRLFYHLVFTTKNRLPLIQTKRDEQELVGYFKTKSNELDAFLEEVGTWYDHVHLLLRCAPNLSLARLYGQLKGFSARAWNLKHPDRMLGWRDGVYIATVDPDDNRALREYIRSQRTHHEERSQIPCWEPLDGEE